jgi:hypothetical protein
VPAPPRVDAQPPGPRLSAPLRAAVDPDWPDGLARLAALDAAQALSPYNVPARFDAFQLYGPFISRRFRLLYDGLGSAGLEGARRFAVTHVAIPEAVRPDDAEQARRAVEGGARIAVGGGAEIWAVPHRPWASFAAAARAVPRQRDTLSATIEAIRSGSGEVILEADAVPPLATGRVLAVERAPERVAIEAEADGDGLLVVNDAFWPGWEARIDGAPAPILAADVLVRAVPFPAGRHRLEMRYAPPEVATGWALTAAGVLAAVLLAVRDALRARGMGGAPVKAAAPNEERTAA